VCRRQDSRLDRHWPFVRFKQANVEHVVEVRKRRQVQLLGHRPHALCNLERPIETRAKLAAVVDAEGSDRAMKQPQPHPISHLEHQRLMVLVIRRLVLLLGLLEMISDFHDELITGAQLVVDGRYARGTSCIRRHGGRITLIDDTEWQRAQ
jgi:hypothetical protein